MGKADMKSKGRPRNLFTRNIEEDRQVSKYRLDEAAEEQADAYGYWSDLLPKFKKKVDDTELEISIVSGQKYAHYKEALDGGVDSKGNVKLPTEGAISNAVAVDNDIIKLKKELNDNREIMGLIISAINTLDQRRSMIKILDGQSERGYYDSSIRDSDQFRKDQAARDKKKNNKSKMNDRLARKSMETEEEIPEEEIGEEVYDDPDESDAMSEEDEIVGVESDEYEESDDESEEDLEEDTADIEDDPEEDTEEDLDDPDDSAEEDLDDPDDSADNDAGDSEEESIEEEDDSAEVPANNPCPFSHIFGKDFGNFDDCDDCDKESPCFRESKKY